MEDFDYSKIVWLVVVAAYFIMQWFGRKRESKSPTNEEGGDETSFEFIESTKQAQRPLESGGVKSCRLEASVESPTEEQTHEKTSFDIRQAVIMSEILAPKFKDK